MLRLKRRKGMASAILMSMCVALSGCLNLGGDEQVYQRTEPLPNTTGSASP